LAVNKTVKIALLASTALL